ncbi:MAG: glycosyltransferase family 2 protein, partial [Blastococcus sp.]|nr:glycosyltransferase family 2 protein [Blastococcus sp.]
MAVTTPDSDGHTPAPALAAGPGHAASPEGRPWVLAGYGVVTVAALTWFGVDPTLGVIAGVLNVVFAVFFIRHLAFAIAAARWGGDDLLAADVGLAEYTPTVAVLVGCKNEELVVDGMVSALLALDYP